MSAVSGRIRRVPQRELSRLRAIAAVRCESRGYAVLADSLANAASTSPAALLAAAAHAVRGERGE